MMLALLLVASLSADDIIARYVTARGGAEKMSAIQNIIYRGVYTEGEHTSPHAAMSLMRPFYKLVGDAEQPNREFAEGYDGSAWEFYADPGIVIRTVGAASAAGRHATSIDGPLIANRERGWTVTLLGRENVGGRDAYRLHVRMADGFEQDDFVDAETFLLIAERKSAPIHAFGASVTSEERIGDYRPVNGVLFPFEHREVEIATGRVLNQMQWTSIVVNHDLDVRVFSPPDIVRTPLQRLLDQLYLERSDPSAVMWSYDDFRRAYPAIDTREGIEVIGYQIVKAGDFRSAIALLEANAATYPQSATSAFGLGRAYAATGEKEKARAELQRALRLDSNHKRAAAMLKDLQ
jgi:Tetratricopeptide repeat